ncbi:unnamed protein product [Coccothraustes coccothraustes]
MGQVLGFAHCKEAPSTASSTPDSTEAAGAPEEEEEEEEDEDEEGSPPRDAPSPRELTFSYIAFGGGRGGGGGGGAPHPPRRGRAPPPPAPPEPGRGGGGLGPPEKARGDPPERARGDPGPSPTPAPPPARGGPAGAGGEGRGGGGGGGDPREEGGGFGGASPPPRDPLPPIFPLPASPAPLPARRQGAPPALPPRPRPRPLRLRTNQRRRRAVTDRVSGQWRRGGSNFGAGPAAPVWELLQWRVPQRSALALLLALLALASLSRFSAVAVLAHGALAVLAVTVPLRLRQVALGVLRPPPPEPPARRAEPLSEEQQQRWARCLARHAVSATRTLTRLFLVQSVPESLKFAFLFYLLTYVGAACNGLTLLAAGVISAFTFPVLYRRHQAQIDQHLSLARGHLSHLRARVLAKLPSAKVKPQ